MIPSKLIQSYSLTRSGLYFLESLPLVLMNRYLAHSDLPEPSPDQLKYLRQSILDLHERDAENVAHGIYPLSTLEFGNPVKHLRSLADVFRDGLSVAWRMRRRNSKDFHPKTEALSSDLPEYYRRNFHFQTDGYLSEKSARRYEHQVEILFNGTAGAMRRLILPPMRKALRSDAKILEIGCGTGSATRLVAQTFPSAKITALDLSAPYLKIAQENLRPYNGVSYLQGDGSQLVFKDETFDAVFSVYLLHELPSEERQRMIKEAWRVLKPGGILVFADSLQLNDDPGLNWALERFPKIYHEPFYTNYLKDPVEARFQHVSGLDPAVDHAVFTKAVWVRKP